MTTYLALFDDSTTDWRVEPSALTTAFQAVWADTIVDPTIRDEARRFTWSFQTSSGPAEAHLNTDGTCLYIDAHLAGAAAIACLFRRYVPGSVDVIFCDEGYTFDFAITPETTRTELIGKVDALP